MNKMQYLANISFFETLGKYPYCANVFNNEYIYSPDYTAATSPTAPSTTFAVNPVTATKTTEPPKQTAPKVTSESTKANRISQPTLAKKLYQATFIPYYKELLRTAYGDDVDIHAHYVQDKSFLGKQEVDFLKEVKKYDQTLNNYLDSVTNGLVRLYTTNVQK